jgi:hypothetical protein
MTTIRQRIAEGKKMDDIFIEVTSRGLVSSNQLERLRKTVLSYRYPRYDGSVTYDVRKVIKVPLSVDGSSGCIVSRVDDIDSFEIDDVDRVENHVRSRGN